LLAKGHELGFADALVMGGWLDPLDIPSYLAAADVAIYPFRDDLINRSKCPAKLTEILRAGVPVVADSVGQLTEYVKPGVSGLLCRPEEWQDMADCAVKLLKNRDCAIQLGATGRDYLLNAFAWHNHAAMLDKFYNENAGAMK
jgi:glycosyltransferase involved in cell wall biosynthesis